MTKAEIKKIQREMKAKEKEESKKRKEDYIKAAREAKRQRALAKK